MPQTPSRVSLEMPSGEPATFRVPISTKLAAALIAPSLALVVLAGMKVQESRDDVADTRAEIALVEAAIGPNGLTAALHSERTTASLTPIGMETAIDIPHLENAEARVPTDTATAEFKAVLDDSPRAAQIYGPSVEALGQLTDLRAALDNDPGPYTLANVDAADAAFNGYSAVMDRFLEANREIALEIEDPQLRRGAQLNDLGTRQYDHMSHLLRHLLLAGTEGRIDDDAQDLITAGGNLEIYERTHDATRQAAREDYTTLGDQLQADVEQVGLAESVRTYLDTGEVNVQELLVLTGYNPEGGYGSYEDFRNGVEGIISDRASDMDSSATWRFRIYLLLAVVTVLVAGVVTWLVSRSITRPLRSLTKQATDMASHKLPDAVLEILNTPLGDDVTVPHVDPVRVKTRDEVADVADALNTVQDSALDLAVEQAVLRRNIADSFVNLGRRNQNLLGRQLDFITELEHNETDPDTLANLFRLDHLATRMRRNAESLLVLAGIDPPRKWAAPVRITDAIRASLGEVEDYQRVTVRAVEPATILGAAAADLAHLLAELIENALIFSPPDQSVEVRGRRQPNGYTLAIIDSGLGMPPDELARANRRLAGAESFTIAPSKYLGHYVAGNLAARHNINVQLHNSPGHGITATINLPPNMLSTSDEQPAGVGSTPEDLPVYPAAHTSGQTPMGQPFTMEQAQFLAQPQGRLDSPSQPDIQPVDFAQPQQAPAEMGQPVTEQHHHQPAAGLVQGGTTPSGLARRRPGTAPVDASRHDHLLQKLANYTGRYSQPSTTPAFPDPGSPAQVPGQAPWPQPFPRPGVVHSGQTPAVSPPLRPAGPATPGMPGVPAPTPGSNQTFVVPSNAPATRSGLTRRVRGAQLPADTPAPLRRTQQSLRTWTGQQSAAKDVYSFLTDFTAGVQRGLAEAEATDPGSEPEHDTTS